MVAEEVAEAALRAAWVPEAAQSARGPEPAERAAPRAAAQQPQGAVARVELPPRGASRASVVAAPEA